MELFVVSFGDSYDRSVVGVARSLDEARSVARDYLSRVHYMARRDDGRPYEPLAFEYFAVSGFAVGVASSSGDDEVRLVLEG